MMAATLLPIALFVWMGYQFLAQEAVHRFEARIAEESRQFATLLQQRLLASRALLVGLADAEGPRGAATELPLGAPLLSGLARVSADGKLLNGSQATQIAWKEALDQAASNGPAQARAASLLWLSTADSAGTGKVLLRHVTADGSAWLAQLEAGFLWSPVLEKSADFHHCVTDSTGRSLNCAAQARQHLALGTQTQAEGRAILRELSLAQDFAAGRWLIATAAKDGVGPHLHSPMFWRWVAVGALATLLLAVGLGWWQLRRTAASLSSLIDGTQRLAEQDWSTRVQLPSGDEFGRLGQSLNLMAERIGHQMQAMQVQSAIDREILGGLDTARVMALVAKRLEALVTDARVAVVTLREEAHEWRAYRPYASRLALPPPQALPELAAGEFAAWCRDESAMPIWAVEALGAEPGDLKTLCWVPAVWQGQMLALLVIGGPVDWRMSQEAQREIGELRDRAAVTLAAAARETALLERAVLDGLTGLLNRNGLHDAIDRQLAMAQAFTLVLVDLDRFKEVNDSLGHQAGDELLCAVAGRLRRCVPAESAIARPGGDEFVLLLPGAPNDATAAALAICAELAKPFALRGVRQLIGGSVGLAAYPQHGHSRVELMRRADMAMYAAKSEGRGRLSWFEAALDERIAQRAWMAQELRKAIDQSQFQLHYQPRVDAVTGETVCAEVLLRWRHPERGMMVPTEFVAAAEETGLIDRLGQWVMAAAFRQMSLWRSQGVYLKRIAVNVSPRQLKVPGFADGVLDMLARHQLVGSDVELEITENLFAGGVDEVIHTLAPLRDAGIQIALDDFGTGYSSLSSLYRLPVDVIKIDRSFVCDLGQRPSADAVARSIVALAKALRKRVVAEGVETRAQRDHLLRLDCNELQGYLYAQPMPADALEQRLRAASAPARTTQQRTQHAAHDLASNG